MPAFEFSPEILAGIAGTVLTLIFSYVPGVNTWFAAKDDTQKRGLMGLLLLAVSVAVFALTCGGILVSGLTCDQPGILRLVWTFILSIIANQSVFAISPRTKAVQEVKLLQARLG